MPTRRQSLSNLFLNKPSPQEQMHLQELEKLSVVHQGRPFLFDDGDLRMMYLTPHCMQSAMSRAEPERLLCAYSRMMMGFLLFHPAPRHIILIGLGGGSLLKYCYRHFPACRITALEISADVIAMRDQFNLPPDSERLTVIHADAAVWLRDHQENADVIFLDAYSEQGPVPALNSTEFYGDCQRCLSPDGVLVANIWGKPSAVAPMLYRLHRQFEQPVRWIRSEDSYNLLVFVSRHTISDDTLLQHLELCQEKFSELPLQQMLATFHRIQHHTDPNDLMPIIMPLRSVLVRDAKVPHTYTEWKARIQAMEQAAAADRNFLK
ncbi:fused MFS/spermidine synthase [Undibacterium oligocarboniphilum]|uniref:Fused MFS/spermidine synthase n=1 Tax=Undibacterium oligocarboniphilum TaxID=666702 RepID=A0A850QL17_9BURK|nr:fused MFS/spermidine synthase [Undibacterium oligocarboniphilum]MBC3869114.1 fused MFS/spermidine synthase [Undibacterium oligocarboniphilum]NVO77094.1 fused MFS/spermidine synthase [Undibacterium oligocarboniphilum]